MSRAGPEATMTATLNATDRCDKCGAQAYVRVEMRAGELLFCAHHAHAYRDALAGAVAIHDETALVP